MNKKEFTDYLQNGDFTGLFVESGWNQPANAEPFPIVVGGEEFLLREVAQKGVRVYACAVDAVPLTAARKALDTKLRKYSNDYLLVFTVNGAPLHHYWMVPVKSVDKRSLVTLEYASEDQALFLLEKINAISFGVDEEATIVDVVQRVSAAFLVNSEKITKDFYRGFRKQHDAFVDHIQGVADKTDRNWYASVMLNRLMFCYFIQKKGFLDGNDNYLRDKLAMCRVKGENQFYGKFYKKFLRVLFAEGLNSNSPRTAAFKKTFGRIPYLNGGMFEVHAIEKKYQELDVPDRVFQQLFEFFDEWHWHLDSRITASGKDINPDVLGYIFEQYINDRAQMGAYYTKEDITEYIGRNCIVPYLVKAVEKADPKPFKPNGEVWKMLKSSGDRYIFPAVLKGVDLPLPKAIEKGVDTTKPKLLERRAHWNEKTDEAYALPTEIWRETVARRQRAADLRAKIAAGAITDIHDFITYNLDLRTFFEDAIRQTKDHLFVKHAYDAIRRVAVLDPTCGSGAFLFAALNILEPLYEACLDRMEEPANAKYFQEQLGEITAKYRSNRQYFIYKNIILRNLYGVDIMHEATEIARLRLFLKMVAVVDVDPSAENLGLDPLPDIDFNIRCGNTLVGFATEEEIKTTLTNGDMFAWQNFKDKIAEELEKTSLAQARFRELQLDPAAQHDDLRTAKNHLRERLAKIRDTLDDYLYESDRSKPKTKWLADTQPFHWYTEFYPIMHDRGGFDVIIGNPPYVEYNENKFSYKLKSPEYKTRKAANLYAFVSERSKSVSCSGSYCGLIVQISSISTPSMESLCKNIKETSSKLWVSNYATRPSSLFDGVCMNLSIIISQVGCELEENVFATQYNRWTPELRKFGFANLNYSRAEGGVLMFDYSIPKLQSPLDVQILKKLMNDGIQLSTLLSKAQTGNRLVYRTAGGRYYKIFIDRDFGSESKSNKFKYLTHDVHEIIAVLSSSLWWAYYTLHFDMYNCKDYMMYGFPYNVANNTSVGAKLSSLGKDLCEDMLRNAERKVQSYKSTGEREQLIFRPALSKPIIDEIDKLLAKHYGFTEEELDFIINYDIKYRMGDELNGEEE